MSIILPISGCTNLPALPPQNLSLDFQNSINQGKIEDALRLIKEGLPLNSPLPNGEMPLHLAVRTNKQDVVLELLALGADPDDKLKEAAARLGAASQTLKEWVVKNKK